MAPSPEPAAGDTPLPRPRPPEPAPTIPGGLLVASVTTSFPSMAITLNATSYTAGITFAAAETGTWSTTMGTTATTAATRGDWATITWGPYDVGTRLEYRPPPTLTYQSPPPTYRPLPPLTAEEVAERDRAVQRAEAAQRRREQAQRAAAGRARELLWSLLDPAQRAEFDTRERITLVGSEGHTFQVDTGYTEGNIHWIDPVTGIELGQMCVHPVRHVDNGTLPLFDVIAGQVLALRTDERAAMALANRYAGALPHYPPMAQALTTGEAA